MSAEAAPKLLTEAEYLEIERAAEFRSEYYRGEMFAMAGATERHVLITGNLFVELSVQLRNRPCRVYNSDLRVQVSASGLYTYPDISIACGERRFSDNHHDNLLNPVALFEVLSHSTEAYDRGAKFELYQALDSLREYVLVAQDRVRVEQFTRVGELNQWRLTIHERLSDQLMLESVGCVVPLAEIYRNVELSGPSTPERSGEKDAA